MAILKKIFTAIRGGAREVGESIVDANSVRIFEQEIKDELPREWR
jgi:phage shock protein A